MTEQTVPGAAAPPFAIGPLDSQEIEAKFAVQDAAVLDELADLPSLAQGTTLSPPILRTITDTYYDTPDFTFLRAGFGLRVREVQPDESPDNPDTPRTPEKIVAIKSLQSLARASTVTTIQQRFEVQGPIPPGKKVTNPTHWPRAVRKQAKSLAGSRPTLHPILVLTQKRTKRWVQADTLPALAELSLDRVHIFDPAGGEETWISQLGELELELLDNQPASAALFAEMVETLAAHAHLTPVGNSKQAQGLMVISGHVAEDKRPVLGVRPEQPMAEAGRVVWRHELMKMLLCEAGVRAGEDMEYVHDMRVATRRSRAALTVFGPYFQKGALDDYAKALRKTARRLGAVRDLDVILDNLARHLAKQTPKQRAQAQVLVDQWTGEREKAQAKLLKWLDSADYRRFIAEFHAFCLHPQAGAHNYAQPPGQPPIPHQVRHILPSAIQGRHETVRAFELLFPPEQEADDVENVPDETLHKLRIEIKALRYNLDFVQHLLGRDGVELLKQLKKLQSHLGDLNDAVEKAARLETLRQGGLDSPFVTHYIDVQMETADRLRRRFPTLWHQFNRPETRSRLGRALAKI